MSYYKEFVLKPALEANEVEKFLGIPTPLPRLTNRIGYLEQGKIIGISGRYTSGKVSFMDYFYLFSILVWWYELEEEVRPPLKIFYYGRRSTFKVKLQKWACLYVQIKYKRAFDPMTLVGGVGKKYDLDATDLEVVRSTQEFFDEIETVLQYTSRDVAPSDIFNQVKSHMQSMGTLDDKENIFHLKPGFKKQQTYVFIDNVNKLTPEVDNVGVMNDRMMSKRIKDYLVKLRDIYNVTSIFCSVTENSYGRNPKDTEPSYKDLGLYIDDLNIGLVMYNPWAEKNKTFAGYEVQDFVIHHKDRLRSVSVVKSDQTSGHLSLPLLFLGENGYFNEAPQPHEEDAINEKLETFRRIG